MSRATNKAALRRARNHVNDLNKYVVGVLNERNRLREAFKEACRFNTILTVVILVLMLYISYLHGAFDWLK